MDSAFKPELCTFGIVFFCSSMLVMVIFMHMIARSVCAQIVDHIIMTVQFCHEHLVHVAQAFVRVILPDHTPAGARRCGSA